MPETLPQYDIDGVEIVEDVSDDYTGEAYKFKTDEPVETGEGEYEYFIVSATTPIMGDPETMVFPGQEEGTAADSWRELAGGMHFGWDIEGALEDFEERYL